ncbi:organic solute transporter Ostalpha-domain-containing protein [Tricladium varicosporioides]|nr:organic solute transporter Ostalpha-domain-containing protein [Hymenoscyphus varicosporioides]
MGHFSHHDSDSSKSNHTCPIENITNPPQVPVIGDLSFHKVIIIISGACMAFSCLVSFYLIMRHATHYSIPKEQRQVIRIIFIIPVFAVVAFLSIAFYSAEVYLKPVEDLYEAFALSAFFYLLCAFVQENDDERQAFLISSGAIKQHTAASIAVLQFPVVMLILLIVTEITQAAGSYCSTSNKIYFAHIWVTVITIISTVIAIMSILKFYKATKPTIDHRRPLPKLIAFKAIVFLTFIQNIIFSFLNSSGVLKPTSHYTFQDLSVGVPSLIISIEMVIFSLAFLYIYRTREYFHKNGATAVPLGHGGYQGGPMGVKALAQAVNIVDIVKGVLAIPRALASRKNPPMQGKVWATGSQGTTYESVAVAPQEYGVSHGSAVPLQPYGQQQGQLYQHGPDYPHSANTAYHG